MSAERETRSRQSATAFDTSSVSLGRSASQQRRQLGCGRGRHATSTVRSSCQAVRACSTKKFISLLVAKAAMREPPSAIGSSLIGRLFGLHSRPFRPVERTPPSSPSIWCPPGCSGAGFSASRPGRGRHSDVPLREHSLTPLSIASFRVVDDAVVALLGALSRGAVVQPRQGTRLAPESEHEMDWCPVRSFRPGCGQSSTRTSSQPISGHVRRRMVV